MTSTAYNGITAQSVEMDAMIALLKVPDAPVPDLAAGFYTGAIPFIVGVVIIALLACAMWLDGKRRDVKNYGTHGTSRGPEDRLKHGDDTGGAFGSGGPGG
jgi:hypothetical protein